MSTQLVTRRTGEKPLSAVEEKITTLLAKDAMIEGVLRLRNGAKIDGIIIGGLMIEGSEMCTMFLSEGAQIDGNVLAPRAIVYGWIKGSIHAHDLVIKRSAKIEGDVYYGRISIEDGAEVNGKLIKASGAKKDAPNDNNKVVIDDAIMVTHQ